MVTEVDFDRWVAPRCWSIVAFWKADHGFLWCDIYMPSNPIIQKISFRFGRSAMMQVDFICYTAPQSQINVVCH